MLSPGGVAAHRGRVRPRVQRVHPALLALVAALVLGGAWPGSVRADDPFDGRFDGYRAEGIAFDPVAMDHPTSVALADDEMTNQFDLGFTSRLFNDVTTQFWVGSNGFISLFQKEDPGCCAGQALPDGAAPNGLIAGFWTDLHPDQGGSITFQTFSSLARPGLPDQAGLAVQYADVPGPGGDAATFQIVFLADGSYEVHIAHASVPAGSVATIGAESFSGAKGFTFVHGDDATFDNVAFRAAPIYTPLIPDLVITGVAVGRPLQPTLPWTLVVHVENDGLGPFLKANIQLTATPAPGPLRGASPGCTQLVGSKNIVEFNPGDGADVGFSWPAPVDPASPAPPRIGDFVFHAVGTITQSAKAEANRTNNDARALGSYLVSGQGGTDVLCQQLPGLPGVPGVPGLPSSAGSGQGIRRSSLAGGSS